MNVPNPGSAEAQKQDCTCPVADNNYGVGVKINGEILFWFNDECPLHGWDANNKPYKFTTKEKLSGAHTRTTTSDRD